MICCVSFENLEILRVFFFFFLKEAASDSLISLLYDPKNKKISKNTDVFVVHILNI